MMELPLSQLIYGKFRETPDGPRVVTLHPHNQFLDAMRETGLAANPDGTVIGVQASKGVYLGRDVVGYMWYVGPLEQPSPVHFGDAMQEIERFLWDEVDRQQSNAANLPFLLGEEQGAVMALAMAGAVPDLISGVVAIDASFPIVPGWDPPLAPLNDLPILLVNPRRDEGTSRTVLTGTALVAMLEGWGATVSVIEGSEGEIPVDRIATWVRGHPIRSRST